MQKTNKNYVGYITISLFSILSGVSFAWTKELLNYGFPVFTIVTTRLIIDSIFLITALKLMGKLERIKRKDYWYFLLLALGEPVIYFIGEDFGMQYVDASFASVVISLIPVAVAFVVPMVYGGKIKKRIVFGATLSIVGILLMSFESGGLSFDIRGLLLLMLAISAAVLYSVMLESLLKKYGAFSVTAYMNLIGALIYLPIFFIFDSSSFASLPWNFTTIKDLLCLGILCSAGAYGLYAFSTSKLGVEKASVFNNVSPIITIVASVAMGMEFFTVKKVLGVLIVVIGVLLSQGLILKNRHINLRK